MPWTPRHGPYKHTHKATTPKKRRAWAEIANKVRKNLKYGATVKQREASAVRIANAVINRMSGGTGRDVATRRKSMATRKRKLSAAHRRKISLGLRRHHRNKHRSKFATRHYVRSVVTGKRRKRRAHLPLKEQRYNRRTSRK